MLNFLQMTCSRDARPAARGHEIAARYTASQFEASGLKPGGVNGSWFQPITFQLTTRGTEPAWLAINGPAGEQRFNHADNVLVWLSTREANYEIAAPLVFVGYGIVDKRLGLDDYRGLNVKGRMVVALRGFPKGLPSEEGAHLSAEKARVAERHGAVGLISISTLQSEKVMPWNRMLEYANEPTYAWVGADGKAHEEAPGIRARATLNGPAAEAVFAGSPRSLTEIRQEADRDKGVPRGFALKTRMSMKVASSWTRVTSPNVVAVLPGADAALAREYVVLSAHLDHLGIKDEPAANGDRIANGALDNAAGVAALLEVARAAAAAPDKPQALDDFPRHHGRGKRAAGRRLLCAQPYRADRPDRRQRRPRHAVAALSLHGCHRVWRRSFDHWAAGGDRGGADGHLSFSGSHAGAGRVHALRSLPARTPGRTGRIPGYRHGKWRGQVLGRVPRGRLSQPA